ncbi:hypothetical protein [Pelagicoccus sp. SDUM812005]|uniref:GumC family protein n=1 Tax=Pelagicoccus sp. SDUM812005 TaxID=3041257 RepID=UPI00280DD254|nr:hypothetical protein [Pelagicoccus sp. SDUM812005]MDQ8180642.1 hypothetical protein [Pelagicoccus sp. SDUM812005]
MNTSHITTIEKDAGPSIEDLSEDILGVAKRKKKLIASVVILTTLLAYVGLQFKSDLYDTTASLIVSLGPENADVPIAVDKGTVHRQGVMKEEINTYISLLSNVGLLEDVIEEIGMERFEPRTTEPQSAIQWVKQQLKGFARWSKSSLNEALITLNLRARLSEKELAVIGIQRRLSIEQVKDSNVIQLYLQLPDPILAQDILDTLIRKYLTLHRERFLSNATTISIFQEQVQNYDSQLKLKNAELLERKRSLGIGSISQARNNLESLRMSIEAERLDRSRQLAQLEETRQAILDNLADIETFVLAEKVEEPNANRAALSQTLAGLTSRRANLLSDFLEESPQIQAIDFEIAAIRELIDTENTDVVLSTKFTRNPIRSRFESELESTEIQSASLKSAIAKANEQLLDLRGRIQALNHAESEIRKLQIEIGVAEKRLEESALKLSEASSREALSKSEFANVNILAAPAYNPKPSAPKRLLIMLAAVIGSFGLGFGLALLLEWLDSRIYDIKSLRSIRGVVLLGEFESSRF